MEYLVSIELESGVYVDCHDIILSGSKGQFRLVLQTSKRIVETIDDNIVDTVSDSRFTTIFDNKVDVMGFLQSSIEYKIQFITDKLIELYS